MLNTPVDIEFIYELSYSMLAHPVNCFTFAINVNHGNMNTRKRYQINSLFYVLLCLFVLLPTGQAATIHLAKGNWAETAYKQLNALISNYGRDSKNYDATNKPYAVFDFDNTTAINDVEETFQIYQIEHLYYKIGPKEMMNVLTGNIPDLDKPLKDTNRMSGEKSITVRMLATDIFDDYTFLYNHYSGMKGRMNLTEIQKTPQYQDFSCKMRYLYTVLTDTFGADVSYTWILFFFKGMTPDQIRTLAKKSVDYWMTTPFEKRIWESPAMGQAGKVTTTFKTGFTITDEMKDLYHCLIANGFDVYICSASLKEIVEAVATNPKYGLNLSRDHVIGMMLKKDDKGRFINEYDTAYPLTFAEGKVTAIKNMIAKNHHGQGPVLVGGDSDGDYNMLTEFSDMQCGLIINRLSKEHIRELCKQAVYTKGCKFVLQGRDENKGIFRASEASVTLGKTEQEKIAK